MKRGIWLPATAAAMLLAGCAAPTTPPLYQWNGYQPQVYEYFKGQKGAAEQIARVVAPTACTVCTTAPPPLIELTEIGTSPAPKA